MSKKKKKKNQKRAKKIKKAKKPKRKTLPKKIFPKKISLKKTSPKKILPKTETEKNEKRSEVIKKTKIRVIGIGGGAGNIVSEITSKLQSSGLPYRATFVVANTDAQALRTTSRNTIRFQFGESFTKGLGAGMNTELAAEAALNEKEKIKKLFQGQDLCIIVASLGGGTGSGATPVFARIAKNSGVMTLGVFTLPFKFEGERKLEVARDSLQKLKPYLNTISILPNERIFETIDKTTPLKEAFSCINKNLAESLQGLIETIYLPGLINIDFADLRTILQGQGRLAFLNSAEVEGANRVVETIKKVINCPLFPYTVKGAKGILFDIAGAKELSLSEVSQISKTIAEMVNPEAKIIFGISESNKYHDKIKVNLLATGCTAKIFSEETEKPKIKALNKNRKKSRRRLPKKKAGAAKKEKKKIKPVRKVKKSKPSRRKIKIKIRKKSKQKEEIPPVERVANNAISYGGFPGETEAIKVRKNGLQIKKEAEETEKEFVNKEQVWELPAFLRRHKDKPESEP